MRSLPLLAMACLAAMPAAASREPVRARKAMVVTREAHATEVGLSVLKSGGNAVDAAVAVGFALAVTHPSAGNIGGGGFMLVRFADGRKTFLDFRERAPIAASRDMYIDENGKPRDWSVLGYLAAGVPGTVKGLEYAHKKYGRKPWDDLLSPAIKLAREGFPISYTLARSLRNKCDAFEPYPDSKTIFLNNGLYYDPGDTLVQPDLAATLDRIRKHGSKDFYEGETARRLAADMKANGGLITEEDLKKYTVVEREPLLGKYKGYDIITAPPPSSGGIGILEMLGVLEGTGYERTGAGSAQSIHWIVETMRRYYADRSEHLADPDFHNVPINHLLSRSYIEQLRASISPLNATPSVQVKPARIMATESADTTHYSIVDEEGNAVAVTYTLNGSYGNGVTATGLGFLLNNEMDDFSAKPGEPNMYGAIQGQANAIQPFKHPLSSMTPTILLKDGQLQLVVGSPGGLTIINTVLQVILNVVDFHMNAQRAVDFPRFHHQWMPDELRMERGYFSPDTLRLLAAKGHNLKFVAAQGEVSAILWDGVWLQGAADSRTDGTAQGY